MNFYFCKNKPNLSIFLPVGCNAKCDFCYSNNSNYDKDLFFSNLKGTLDTYDNLTKISITGGEPTIDPLVLERALKIIRSYPNITKVVLNTNGYAVGKYEIDELINEYVDRLNISRHSFEDSINTDIFKCNISFDLLGITRRVNMNTVIDKFPNEHNLDKFIKYALDNKFSSLTFRKNFQIKDFEVPDWLEKYIVKTARSCNGKITFMWFEKDGFKFNLSSGHSEPCEVCSKFNNSKSKFVYELILDANGVLKFKWGSDGEVVDKIKQPKYINYCMSFSRKDNKLNKFDILN